MEKRLTFQIILDSWQSSSSSLAASILLNGLRQGVPRLLALILTHMLQTEVKSKMNALKKRLQREPAFPDGSPTRRTIMGACQIATQACHFRPKRTHRHGSRRVTRALGQHGQHQRLNHRIRGALWVFTSAGTHLQQAHGKRRQQTQQAHQAINRRPLTLLNATATFEALVIVLVQKASPIPVHALPRLFDRCGGHRGQQDPFQWLLSLWSFLFPHTNDPHGQRLLARSWLMTWWQERHLTKGKLELCTPLLMIMPSGKLQHTARLAGKGPGLRQRIGDLFLAFLHAPILCRSHQKVRLRRATRLEEREHIRTPIADTHPQACR